MTKYIIKRIIWFIPVLFFVILVTFLLMHAMPGGPFDFSGEKRLPAAIRKNIEAKYHLNEPEWKQFVDYVIDVLHGDFGPSMRYRDRSVNDIIGHALPISAELGFWAMMLALLTGVPLGIIAALKQNTIIDYSATTLAILGVAMPNIVLAPWLIYIFSAKLHWLPAARWGGVDHKILPVLALGTALSASIARLTRASLLQVMREDYIRTARAKGLAERWVVIRHALKNSMIPVVTILGPMFAGVLTGTFIVEQIFAIPGLGRHFIWSIGNRDYPLIMGTALVYGIAIVIANLLVDITYAWMDPRIRYD